MAYRKRIRLANGLYVDVADATWRLSTTPPAHFQPADATAAAGHLQGRGAVTPLGTLPLTGKHIVQPGCGSVGSQTGRSLTDLGADLTVIDDDVVEPSNVEGGRTIFGPRHVGADIVLAFAEIVRSRGLPSTVVPVRKKTRALSDEELLALIREADLVVAAFDDPPELFRLNRLFYAEVPVVYPAFHQGARTGHVIWTAPGLSPCLTCTLGISSPDQIRTLAGASALPLDIQRISNICVRVALWLCAEPGSEAADLLDPTRNVLLIGNRPEEDVDDGGGTASAGLPVRFLPADADPECPVCGPFAGTERR